MGHSNIDPKLERQIERYVNEELTEKQIDELWAELLRDEDAYDYLRTAVALKKIAGEEHQAGQEESPAAGAKLFNLNRRSRLIAVAAAILILAGSIGLLQFITQPETVEPIASIELDYYRSADAVSEEAVGEEAIRQAIVLANQGEYQQALTVLEEKLAETSDPNIQARLLINAGSILYNISRYDEAASQFEMVIDIQESDFLIRERAFWLLGNTYFQLNKMDEAKSAFQNTYELNGAYSRVAQSYLRALASS